MFFSANLLLDGRVLLAGGGDGKSPNSIFNAELYNPTTRTFSFTAGQMTVGREAHRGTLLTDGKVLIAGGDFENGCGPSCNNGIQDTAELFDPITNTFTATGNMAIPRLNQVAVALADGQVIEAGGYDGIQPRGQVDLYTP